MATVGGSSTAGTKLKTSDWGGTNDYGFSALPGGYRNTGGSFGNLGSRGYGWTASEYDASYAGYRRLDSGYTDVNEFNNIKSYGFSVRCLQD
jgi:uncharacterized protein (TIGR02145 family)